MVWQLEEGNGMAQGHYTMPCGEGWRLPGNVNLGNRTAEWILTDFFQVFKGLPWKIEWKY